MCSLNESIHTQRKARGTFKYITYRSQRTEHLWTFLFSTVQNMPLNSFEFAYWGEKSFTGRLKRSVVFSLSVLTKTEALFSKVEDDIPKLVDDMKLT